MYCLNGKICQNNQGGRGKGRRKSEGREGGRREIRGGRKGRQKKKIEEEERENEDMARSCGRTGSAFDSSGQRSL